MNHRQLIHSVLVVLLGAALFIPAGLAAQEEESGDSDETASTLPEDGNRHREFHQRARERFKQGQEQVKQDRQALRQAIDEYGQDSSQAREARRTLQGHQNRLQDARQRFGKRHGQAHRVARIAQPLRHHEEAVRLAAPSPVEVGVEDTKRHDRLLVYSGYPR